MNELIALCWLGRTSGSRQHAQWRALQFYTATAACWPVITQSKKLQLLYSMAVLMVVPWCQCGHWWRWVCRI